MLKLKVSFLFGCSITLILLFLILLVGTTSAAASGWLGTSPLKLEKQFDFNEARPLNEVKNCYPETASSCSVPTRYGFVNSSGSVRLNSSDSYYSVSSYVSNQGIIGIPHSDTFITYSSEPSDGVFIYINKNFLESTTLIDKFGKRFKVTKAPEWRLADRNGNRIAVDVGSRAFSQNGQWMVVAAPYIGIIRINLDTFEFLPFGPGYSYGSGLSPNPQLSITNDGRYALVASGDFNNFNLYDLSTCLGTVPDRITKSLDCQNRDIHSYLQGQLGGYIGSSNVRFISNDIFSFNSRRKEGLVNTAARYTISNNFGQAYYQDYIALGDSYISGEGAYNYQPGTDTSNNGCHLSLDSYPLLIGKTLNFNSYHSIACSGAVINDIIDGSGNYPGQLKNKIFQQRIVPEDLRAIKVSFFPGHINQMQFVSQYRPKVITISIGGNDIGFTNILKRCLAPGVCYSSYEDRLELIRQINRKFPIFSNTYSLLKSQAAPDTKIFVIGYPQIANPNGSCGLNVHLTGEELVFAQQLIGYLNGVIKAAADKSGVAYIDTQSAMDGHKLCEGKPGEVAVNGLSAGNDFPAALGGPIGKESFHPNELGHKLMKDYVLQYSENFYKSIPLANSTASPPAEGSQQILAAPRTGRAINISSFSENIVDDTVNRSVPFQTELSGNQFSVKPNSTVTVVLNSTPVNLGSFQTNSLGDFKSQITIPPTVESGIHTFHIYGTDISDQPIDVYKTIYVNDANNNLASGSCVAVQAAKVDYDQDGTDDACDANITVPPPKVLQTIAINYSNVNSDTPTLSQNSLASSAANNTHQGNKTTTGTSSIIQKLISPDNFGYVLDDLNFANYIQAPSVKMSSVDNSLSRSNQLVKKGFPQSIKMNTIVILISGLLVVAGGFIWKLRV